MTSTSDIKVIPVPVSDEETLNKLETFAASFDHTINRGMKHDIFTDEKGNWLGYAESVQVPVFWTGWHPEANPVAVKAAIQLLQSASHYNWGIGLAVCREDSPFFKVMEKFNFARQGQLFMSQGRGRSHV